MRCLCRYLSKSVYFCIEFPTLTQFDRLLYSSDIECSNSDLLSVDMYPMGKHGTATSLDYKSYLRGSTLQETQYNNVLKNLNWDQFLYR